MSYDAILLTSFGGPEGPDEVMPYLERVTAGRGIPQERLVEVSHHYMALGGVSPINDQNRALLAKLKEHFPNRGIDIPVYWGNRNSEPYFADVVKPNVRGWPPHCPGVGDKRLLLLLRLPPVSREPL